MNGNTYGSSEQAICPYLFKNANLNDGINLAYQVDSFLFVSLFRFQTTDSNETEPSINSEVGSFIVNGFNYVLDTGLLHPLVFESMRTLMCAGKVDNIQPGLFKHFLLLDYIQFNFDCLGNFYHKVGIEWMGYLNNCTNVTLVSAMSLYTYPDRDLCIFAQFPREKIIVLSLDSLTLNDSNLIYEMFCSYGAISRSVCENLSVNLTILESQIDLCNAKKNKTEQQKNAYTSYTEYYETKLISMMFIELVPFVFIPITCLIGLYLNWKVIQTVQRNEKKELKEDFYQYMSVNAKFNSLYCVIFSFYPMTSCNYNLSVYFCSKIYTTQFVQYYKIVMIAYFSEVFKMCANISYLMMTLNRFLLVGKDHPPWLVKLAKLKFKHVIRSSFLFSAFLSIGHGWQYKAVQDTALLHFYSFSANSYSQVNGESYSDYPQANQNLPYFIYSIFYFAINFGAFFIQGEF
jgi:hypothetical protein